MTYLKALWAAHGTKLLGALEMLLGLLEYVDQNTVNLVGTALGPHYGPIVSKGLQIGAGAMVARRGYMNSRRHDNA